MKDRRFQHQQHQPSRGEPPQLASRGPARRRMPSGTQSGRHRVPGGRNPAAGYHAVWRGEKRWNGVAILARWAPVVTRVDLPGDTSDGQCRYLEAAVNGVLVASIYAPNGNPQPGPKYDYKLAWLERLNAHGAENSTRPERPWCWRETTTSCRPISTSIRRRPGIATPCCSHRVAQRMGGRPRVCRADFAQAAISNDRTKFSNAWPPRSFQWRKE